MIEAYSVAVRISLINSVSAGLAGMSRDFLKVHGNVGDLQKRLDRLKMTMAIGAGMTGAGLVGIKIVDGLIKPATEYAHQLAQLNILGMQHADVVRSIAAAWQISHDVPTTTAAENLASIRELRQAMASTDIGDVIGALPTIQRLQGVLKDVRGDLASARDEAYEVAKALELKGAVKTPTLFLTEANLMTKDIVASGGKVAGSDFLNAFKYGRAATAGWDQEFTYQILPTLIQEMKSSGGAGGGGGPGNALMSAYATVVGGTIPQKALKEWQKVGLLDPSKIVYDRVGSAKGVAPGGIKGSDEFISNPFGWVQKYLMPSLLKAGITNEKAQREALQYLFPNRTAGFVMTQMAEQPWKFERDRELIKNAQGLEAYDQLLKTDPEMAAMALRKQWENLLATLGFQVMPPLIAGTQKLISVVQSITGWTDRHATATKLLVSAFAGLSVISTIAGPILLLGGALATLRLAGSVAALTSQVAGVGAAATTATTGLVTMGAVIAGMVGVIAAGAAGYGIGSLIYNYGIAGTKLGDNIGDGVAQVLALFGNKEARRAIAINNGFDPYNQLRKDNIAAGIDPVTDTLARAHAALRSAGLPASSDSIEPPMRDQTINVNSVLQVDGREMAANTTKHQVRAASRAQTSTSFVDLSNGLIAPGQPIPQ